MTKEEKKAVLFGQKDSSKDDEQTVDTTVTLMGHWNNDSGCRLD